MHPRQTKVSNHSQQAAPTREKGSKQQGRQEVSITKANLPTYVYDQESGQLCRPTPTCLVRMNAWLWSGSEYLSPDGGLEAREVIRRTFLLINHTRTRTRTRGLKLKGFSS